MNNAKLPPFLIQKLEKQYGKEVTSNIIQGYQAKRKTTFRVNNLKAKTSEVLEILEKICNGDGTELDILGVKKRLS